MAVETTAYSELVDSLREQLKLQQAINCQYEVDMEARDELVSVLQTRLKCYEETIIQHCAELEHRRMSMKSLGCTVARLERLCHELEEELERSREESRVSEAPENSINQIDHSRLTLAEQQIGDLTQELKSKEAEIDLLNQERQYATDNVSRLEGLLRKRDADLEQTRARIVESEHEAGELRSQASSAAREHARAMDEQIRLYNKLEQQEAVTKSELDIAIKDKAKADVMVHTLQDQTTHLTNEIQQLRRQIHALKQESADKEVKILQLNKQHQQDQEDKAGLNLALDSKQQELELLKRRLSVKGTGGSTPAYSRRTSTLESSNGRGPLAFTTPRPSSAIGMSHTPPAKGNAIEDTSNLTTVKPVKVGLPMTGQSTKSQRQATPGARNPTRQYLSSANGTPSTSNFTARSSHHRRSSSVTSITSGSEKENSRTKTTRVSVPA